MSQFTLYAHMKGSNPDFHLSMPGEKAHEFFDAFVARMGELVGPENIATGRFGTHMHVITDGDGPVTIILDSKNRS